MLVMSLEFIRGKIFSAFFVYSSLLITLTTMATLLTYKAGSLCSLLHCVVDFDM